MIDTDRRIRRIAIVGGGVAGWTAAATLARKLGGQCSIHVIDSAEAASAGFAEASHPAVLELLRQLGVDQNDFVDKTQSTYSLGTRLVDWATPGQSSWHPFGAFGALIERRPFYHYWHKARVLGLKPRVELFSLETSMALANRFIFPTNTLGVAQHMRYALHLDGALAARYLRGVAERAGVIRLERKVVSAARGEGGLVEELKFEDGGSLRADLYIDASGARAQLVGEVLGTPLEDWSRWLPCDRMLSAPVALEDARTPAVRVTARPAGWSWRMPLQAVAGAGQVWSSAHQDEDAARQELVAAAGTPLAEPRLTSFVNGRRRVFWDQNVIAIGQAAGCLEPLAAADLLLLGGQLFNLLDHFPDKQFDPANTASYNAAVVHDFDRTRDFTILHYATSRRDDSPFWQQNAQRELPDSLRQRLEQYRASGRIVQQRAEPFSDLDWFFVLEGAGVVPRDYDPLVDTVDFEQVKRLMLAISQKVSADVAAAPTHDSFFAAANARLAGARKAAAAAVSG
ncbi:MAG TPA: tryptophan halogenase family protein [Steroidobacteraceae bacterium]|nr:tryptophan halogenase family protein [Steroidobacteraceae bacterium]